MLEILTAPALNRLLRPQGWALERLRAHAGKTAVIACPPASSRLTVLATGEVAPARPDAVAAVTIEVTPGLLLRVAARDESAFSEARVSGDMDFAAAIDFVRRNLTWDFEEDLSRVFGDMAAHRIAGAVRELDRWGRSAARNVGGALSEYATYEDPVIASRPALETFNRDVDEARDAVARLEKRIALIARRLDR